MKARLIFNNIIPFKGFKAITILPWIFVRKDASKWTLTDERHEKIHLQQQLETLLASLVITVLLSVTGVISHWWVLVSPLVYFVLYGLDWLVRWLACGFDGHTAYRNIAAEQEAYVMQTNVDYLKIRKTFAHFGYIFRKTYKKR